MDTPETRGSGPIQPSPGSSGPEPRGRMGRLELRSATVADQTALFEIHEALFCEYIDRIWGWDSERQIENFHKEWLEVETVTIHEAGQLAGYLQTREEPDHVYVLNLAIREPHQNRGIGSWIITRLKRRDTALRLGVFRTNDRTLALYLRHGFRVTAETDSGYKLQWNPGQDTPSGELP